MHEKQDEAKGELKLLRDDFKEYFKLEIKTLKEDIILLRPTVDRIERAMAES